MGIRIGINGFGRMGRLALRAAWDWPEFEIVHINEVKEGIECAAHLLEFDSVHGGWIGSLLGLKITLFAGLALQVVALSALALLDPGWPVALSVAYVMGAQALSGIAKDLTKMSSKSAIKVLIPADAKGALFKWVAILTGSKNAFKGAGFFLGGVLLAGVGFRASLLAMAAGLTGCLWTSMALVFTSGVLSQSLPREKTVGA